MFKKNYTGFIALKRRRTKIILLALVLIIGISAFLQGFVRGSVAGSEDAGENKNSGQTAQIKTGRLSEQTVDDNREYFGEILYCEKVSVSSKVNGKLEHIYIREGQKVKPGELIARIEKLPLELTLKQQTAELEIAKTALSLAQAKYDNAMKSIEIKLKDIEKAHADLADKDATLRNVDRLLQNKRILFEEGGVSETELKALETQQVTARTKSQLARADCDIQEVGFRDADIIAAGLVVPKDPKEKLALLKKINSRMEMAEIDSARSHIRQVEANIESTRILIRETDIISPLRGIVASKNMDAGELVKSESIIANLININDVYLVMNISERDVVFIKTGQKVRFTVDAIDKRHFEGAIVHATPVLDAKTRTMTVKALIHNSDMILLPGMFARAEIQTGKSTRMILLPLSAIAERKESAGVVFIVKKGIVFRQNVDLGRDRNGMIECLRGITPDDEIVLGDLAGVFPGMKVGQ
jgi:multidrug efflux pump subunit AcrA (membrane-fusion protein)